MPVLAAIAIGSNVGDRESHVFFARDRLAALLDHFQVSRVFETDPAGVVGPQPRFLNAAAVGSTALSARELLEALLAIEHERGRERLFPRAPRTLDLDLILFGDQVIDEEGLSVPHPRFRERRFVLEPLAEIAPWFKDPVTGKTMKQLLTELTELTEETG